MTLFIKGPTEPEPHSLDPNTILSHGHFSEQPKKKGTGMGTGCGKGSQSLSLGLAKH